MSRATSTKIAASATTQPDATLPPNVMEWRLASWRRVTNIATAVIVRNAMPAQITRLVDRPGASQVVGEREDEHHSQPEE